ncbi:Protein kinase superfamily protein [Euphorbia peplus]|nr:Protein kinase superfamily protein [Euphorbia peplus]
MSLVGLDSLMHQAWSLVLSKTVRSIAILGEGGIGKTTLMRQLYNKLITTQHFKTVIWVTVSSNLTFEKLQDDISKSIGIFNAAWVESTFTEKSQIMLEELSSRNKFVLFLDDLWEWEVDLQRLGIPFGENYKENSSKLIFTTRSETVAKNMYAPRVLTLMKLSTEDAWQLFWNKVGDDKVADSSANQQSYVYMIAEVLVAKCGGLPLLLSVLGRVMAGRKSCEEWFYALDEIHRMKGMDSEVTRLLEFCFNRLPSRSIKSCLSYLSLFPEDFTILKNDLIDFWICEQLLGVDDNGRDKLECDVLNSGYNAMDTIIAAGLLDEENAKVKLLDMIRDAALSIAIGSPMFENAQLLKATDIEKLATVGWISPMGDSIRNHVPNKLLAFLLNHNPFIMIKGPFTQILKVQSCEKLKEIVSLRRLGEMLEEEDVEPFGKLEMLALESLPELKSIYWKSLPLQCLKKIEITECFLLKKLPLNINSTKKNELVIEAEEDWWKNVKWDDDLTKAKEIESDEMTLSAEEDEEEPPLHLNGPDFFPTAASQLIPHLKTSTIRTKLFTYEELALATENFSLGSNFGRGSFSKVYSGKLSNTEVVIKKFLNPGRNESHFVSEILAISRINHPNIVKMVGYCTDYANRMLVLEYMPNRSLKFHLHGKSSGIAAIIWLNRMKIALGTAKGLAYLHSCNPKIIHRNIKTNSILLDFDFEPKIAGFEIAVSLSQSYSHVMTDFKGTFGYMAPEYMKERRLSDKVDVFCFGIVLLGLITGKKPYSYTKNECPYLTTWAIPLLEFALLANEYDTIVDPRLGNAYVQEEMGRMIRCAAACVYKPEEIRPGMTQIVEALQGNLPLEHIWHHRKDKQFLRGPLFKRET